MSQPQDIVVHLDWTPNTYVLHTQSAGPVGTNVKVRYATSVLVRMPFNCGSTPRIFELPRPAVYRNHTGFYVAREKGLYEQQGLTVQLLSPHEDDYHETPARKLVHARDQIAFAVAPSETVISAHTRSQAGQRTSDAPQVGRGAAEVQLLCMPTTQPNHGPARSQLVDLSLVKQVLAAHPSCSGSVNVHMRKFGQA